MKMSTKLSKSELRKAVHQALKHWSSGADDTLVLFDSLHLMRSQYLIDSSLDMAQKKRLINQLLLESIESLEVTDYRLASVLRLRFIDNNKILAVSNQLNESPDTVSRIQKKAIDQLSVIIWDKEQGFREQKRNSILSRIPSPTYQFLCGAREAILEVSDLIVNENQYWITSIVGIGGIGKTALAHAVVTDAVQYDKFEDIIWIRFEEEVTDSGDTSVEKSFTQIITKIAQKIGGPLAQSASDEDRHYMVRQQLKSYAYLIVLDNLEHEKDASFLITQLNDLCNPSKFLLTSRTQVSGLSSTYNYRLRELSKDDSIQLLAMHADTIGVEGWHSVKSNDIDALYELVGGNPLALKLVVSLLDIMSLNMILEKLKASHARPIEQLYLNIFWQAWISLTDSAKMLLLIMPLVSEDGGTVEYLMEIGRTKETEFWPALQELRRRSLVEIRGTLFEKKYGIHRLTESFLSAEVLQLDPSFRNLKWN